MMKSNDIPLYESVPTKKSMGKWIFQTIEIYAGGSGGVCFKAKGDF